MRKGLFMEKKFYSEKFLTSLNIQSIPPSDLIRNDSNLFTFSPIQDELEKFDNNLSGIFYKEQLCFRQVYPANLINPLSTPCQKLISFFSFEETNYIDFITKVSGIFLNEKVNFEDIYVIIPNIDSLRDNFTVFTRNIITIDPNRLKCKLPLRGNHYYIKICVKYNNGLVTLINFVLVDYKYGSKLSKIDSVLFPLRLDMVSEQAKSLFETIRYRQLYQNIYNITDNHEITHFIVSQLLAISILLLELKEVSNRKQGYLIKKLAREFFLECDCNHLPVKSILSYFPKIEKMLTHMYSEYSITVHKAVRKIQNSKPKIDAKYAHETLGLPYKLYQLLIDPTYQVDYLPSNFAYYRDATRNRYDNPIERYR